MFMVQRNIILILNSIQSTKYLIFKCIIIHKSSIINIIYGRRRRTVVFIFFFSENKIAENDGKEDNEEPANQKPRIFRHTQHETSLTPLMEGNTADNIE